MQRSGAEIAKEKGAEPNADARPRGLQVARSQLSYERVAEQAYRYWQERGCPEGSPEEDWFRAEQDLQRMPETLAKPEAQEQAASQEARTAA
jgi:hypothetical protein